MERRRERGEKGQTAETEVPRGHLFCLGFE